MSSEEEVSGRTVAEDELPASAIPEERPGPVGGKRDRNRRERVRRLLGAATRLFLERGIEPTTILEITRAAGMAKGSFYRYFPDKAALVGSLFTTLERRVRDAFSQTSRSVEAAEGPDEAFDVYSQMGGTLTEIVLADLPLMRLYLQENRAPSSPGRQPIHALSQMIGREVIVLTEKAQAHGLLRAFPPEVSALGVLGAVERILYGVLTGERFGNPQDLGARITSLVLDGLRPRD